MRFELKTENENYSKLFSKFLVMFFILTFIFIFSNIAIKLGIIARHYQINYNCRLLAVERSTTIFKKLSRISNLNSKQRILEFCKEVVK